MGECFLHGNGSGGAKLNFTVVGGMDQPVSVKENMIWVKTDRKFRKYYLSPTAPQDITDDMVWIVCGWDNQNGFHALRDFGVMVYIRCAKQFISGAWVDVPSFYNRNGSWVQLYATVHIYKAGIVSLGTLTLQPEQYITAGTNAIVFTYADHYGGWGYFTETFDLTNYKKMKVKGTQTDAYNGGNIVVSVTTTAPDITSPANVITRSAAHVVMSNALAETEFSVDISNLSGAHYIEFAGIANGTITEIWFE